MMFAGMKEFTVRTDDAVMNCIRFGRGKKTMLLISGLNLQDVKGRSAAFGLYWMYRGFARDFTVYCFDRRENLPAEFTVKQIADDIAAAMIQMNLQDAYVLGVSQGGMIAQYLALDHPQLVSRLVLGVTSASSNEMIQKNISRWISMAENDDMKGIIKDYMHSTYSDAYIRRMKLFLPLVIRMTKMMPKERFITCARACLTCDTLDRLDQIKCPCLVLGGEKDKVVSPEASGQIAEKTGCNIYMYADYGHSAYEEMAADFNRRVQDFFA